MRLPLVYLAIMATGSSCAYRSGATYAGAQIQSKWVDLTVGTDLEGAETSAEGMKIAKQDQSKVANQAIKTAGTLGAAAITAGMLEGMNADNLAADTALAQEGTKQTALKEGTKRAANANATAVQQAKIHAAAPPLP
jgi:hypothetical protein